MISRLKAARADSDRSFIACEVGEAFYVLPVEEVQEILQPLSLTPLAHAPSGIVGAVEHRGKVIPILDLGSRLGFGETVAPRRKWVVLVGAGRTIGVVVSRVHEVFETKQSELREAPNMGSVEAQAARQILSYRERMAFVLSFSDIARLADWTLSGQGDE